MNVVTGRSTSECNILEDSSVTLFFEGFLFLLRYLFCLAAWFWRPSLDCEYLFFAALSRRLYPWSRQVIEQYRWPRSQLLQIKKWPKHSWQVRARTFKVDEYKNTPSRKVSGRRCTTVVQLENIDGLVASLQSRCWSGVVCWRDNPTFIFYSEDKESKIPKKNLKSCFDLGELRVITSKNPKLTG